MTPVTHARGRNYAVVGLGGSGLATARALVAGGAHVFAWDDSEAQRVKALQLGFTCMPVRDMPWQSISSLVLAPGIPLTHRDGQPYTHEAVAAARLHGAEVIGDIELFCRERAAIAPLAPFVAITGTNGKSTTTALISHILRSCQRDVQMGGNIGAAILSLEPPSPARVHVIEISSFQIDLTPNLQPDVGVLMNLTPDHLDRHGTVEDYWRIKHRLIAASQYAIIGIDDEWGIRSASLIGAAKCVTVSTRGDADFVVSNGSVIHRGERLVSLAGASSLRGAHNGQNAAVAVAACLRLGCALSEIQSALLTFPGLAHRMEIVGRKGHVLFVNDSKATNADSTEKALLSFSNDIFWIAGGKAKDGGITPLAPHFGRVAKAYLIGVSSEAFAATLHGKVPFELCGTLDVAVTRASEDAARSTGAEPVVLLSPACASYDQFANFEVRGDHFRALCKAIVDGPSNQRAGE